VANEIKVDKSGYNNLVRRLKNLENVELQWGFFEDARYGPENNNLPVAFVAQQNMTGFTTPSGFQVPPRPFMYDQIFRIKELTKDVSLVGQYVLTAKNWYAQLDKIGKRLEEDLKQTIDDWEIPANAAMTIALKGRNDPLVDSGKMLESVEHKIVKKGDK
jgi:hypothetical protein